VNGAATRPATCARTGHRGCGQPVTDPLQASGVVARQKAVVERFEADSRLGRLAFGPPLVTVEVSEKRLGDVVLALPRPEVDQRDTSLGDEPVERRNERLADRIHQHRRDEPRVTVRVLEQPPHPSSCCNLG